MSSKETKTCFKPYTAWQYQEEEDSEEVKKKIPLLKRSDIRRESIRLYNEEHCVDGISVVHHDLFTNGIGYLTLLFNTERVPDEQIPYMGILIGIDRGSVLHSAVPG